MPAVVVCGVSGSGKSSVARALADRLALPFADADDFHPRSNVAKMAAGQPLDDEDRRPWLAAVGVWMAEQVDGCVVACSALSVTHRDLLRQAVPEAVFVQLSGDEATVQARVAARTGHFMPATLVRSQYDALEPLAPGERGGTVDFAQSLQQVVADAQTVVETASG